MTEVGSLWVRLRGDTKEFESAMRGVSSTLNKTSAKMQTIGGGMSTYVTLPLLAAGGAAIAAATEVEGAMAQIRASTGATGDELAALRDDFEVVAKKVPQDLTQVATAVGDVHTRLGLTGEPLRKLTEQMLELADLTKTQVEPLIASTTRVFGDWSVATEEQADTLDLLYKVSQATGIEVGRLSDSLVAYGAPLRQMGFDLEEAAVLMGKWETEGVNMELVLGSLRLAMGHFAREGIPMREGLDETMQRIQELGPGAEATALAMEVFGARAGPDMAAAILEGRFEIDKLMETIQDSPDTIMAAGAATETFADKLGALRNNTLLAIEPIGVQLMDALTNIMPQLLNIVEKVAQLTASFSQLTPETQTTILTIGGLLIALGPVVTILGKVISIVSAIVGVLGPLKVFLLGTATTAGFLAKALTVLKLIFIPLKIALLAVSIKVLAVVAAVAALGYIIYYLITNWEEAKQFLLTTLESIMSGVRSFVDAVVRTFKGTDWAKVGKDILRGIVGGLDSLRQWAIDKIINIGKGMVDGFKNFFGIDSPSKVMAEQFRNLAAGANLGWDREFA
ncbi:MAG TPA: phage tail tape measure protein, partial [Dissulfurispiraceae bacterium]|nr:phage tail tape measure protein [Dissulfurispiraceae bacterium]